MSKIHFSRRELSKAFRVLKGEFRLGMSRRPPSSNRGPLLLGLYALECGLKSLLLEERAARTTADLDQDDLTHCLNDLLRKIGAPAGFRTLQATSPAKNPPLQVPSQNYHQLYRYGGRFSPTDERQLRDTLQQVLQSVEERRP